MKKLFIVILFFLVFISECMASFGIYGHYSSAYNPYGSYNDGGGNNTCCVDYMVNSCKKYLADCLKEEYIGNENKREINELEEYPLKNKVNIKLKEVKKILKINKLTYSVKMGFEAIKKNKSIIENETFVVSKTLDFLDLIDLMLESDDMKK